ncbi:sn-glycerol-3-phosphate ABC transporter ATP-binding protein UgpC [Alginatibacterium sediminis]|uniref:sn-glycerol-3-phosphate ABC transporter ATP-binding protein UgpC n=1 Tax=Alginatibacterium sediminis TaxID=2164068 RepID=A0A420EBA1_9ALTE|nr:sn-glycerol-3-phosphate ABC transporter ATP-binding protein UgpC [Alginatibacterium sediminis]RKF17960.1 sn-glycerol-3-phosphate ABC transporter ATP-binding protein UgpC [Alginatibacterium sediminis]
MGSVKLGNVVKRFGDTQTIHGVDIEIKNGEFVVFVGPSGCGKSTLLRMIAGLESITEGSIEINDQVVNHLQPSQRGIAMVFQSYALYPHMTVRENIGFSMKLAGTNKEEMNNKIELAAKSLKLEPLLDRKPANMSGGQRQRVAIGRAIVRNPEVFLFDEPLSNLDAELRVQMRMEIARLHKELDSTMVYVTHDQVEAMTLADKIVVLNEGRVEQIGSPLELYQYPMNLFVAGFIGSPKMNFLQAEVIASDDDGVAVKLGDGSSVTLPNRTRTLKAGVRVTIGVRPEHLNAVSDACKTFRITVEPNLVENLGGHSFLYTQFANDPVSVEMEGIYIHDDNSDILLEADIENVHLFDESGFAVR